MADNNIPSNSKEHIDCEDEGNIVTMVDVLKAEETLEENADAVLGPGDDKNCTYSQGIVKRQALYSCLTCMPSANPERAGVCLACSYHCHSDHDLVELYTKRNFTCDCGNSLFKENTCSLAVKTGTNEKNYYNQNFNGTYCSCKRPYPDPDDTVEDEMIQCIVCEDWFHTRHLESEVPKEDEYSEMICAVCMDRLPFLQYYLGYAVNKVSKEESKDESDVDISVTEETLPNSSQKAAVNKTSISKEAVKENQTTNEGSPENDMAQNSTDLKLNFKSNNSGENVDLSKCTDSKKSITGSCAEDENKIESSEANKTLGIGPSEATKITPPVNVADSEVMDKQNGCQLKNLTLLPRRAGATFWPEEFRKLLCSCNTCLELYKSCGVPFLPDVEDTVRFYEEEGKLRKLKPGVTQYERGMEALSSLDRVQQMEAILSYNEMKTHLSEYLAKFVANKKVVREEDIREFFSGMTARKRQKLDIPYNCR